jgi:hypothetical protein
MIFAPAIYTAEPLMRASALVHFSEMLYNQVEDH